MAITEQALQLGRRMSVVMLMPLLLMICLDNAISAAPSGSNIALHGNASAPACVSCHGASGQGMTAAAVPRLAGLDAGYLAEQLISLRDGSRLNPVMTPIAKGLSDEESRSVASYYATISAVDVPGTLPAPGATGALNAGRGIAQNGLWSKQVPACGDCHGKLGLGVGAAFPPLAGQPSAYLASQLEAYQQGSRSNGPLGLMQGVAGRLSAADISLVSDYYAGLDPRPTNRKANP